MTTIKYCPGCGKEIYYKSIRCRRCANLGKNNPQYKDGSTSESRVCSKCGNKISNFSKGFCQKCYFETLKGEGNPNYKGEGIIKVPKFIKENITVSVEINDESSGIYRIRNLINNHTYVGSAISFKDRWIKHRTELRSGAHKNSHLQKTWDLYGESNFIFEILEFCSESELINLEQHYLDQMKPEYNILLTAGSSLGYKHTKESRLKISLANKGKLRKPFSDETKQKMSISFTGRKLSEETKQKIRQTRIERGIKCSSETVAKQVLANTGQKRSEETKLKISQALKGKKNAQGIVRSKESIEKMLETRKKNKEAKLLASQ